jgi:transglutaminase-like putative cysteine protease
MLPSIISRAIATTARSAFRPQVVRLRPAPHSRTPILSYSLKITPAQHFINWQQDPQANYLARLVFPERPREFCVEVDLVAEMAVINPFDFFLEPYADDIPLRVRGLAAGANSNPISSRLPLTPALRRLPGDDSDATNAPASTSWSISTSACPGKVRYVIRLEPGVQTPEETLELARGSCRDSAWLLVQVLRNLGLAARFVSGYLIQLVPDVKSLDGPSGTDHRLHRPARLVRGVPARRRLDRPRPDLRPVRRRGPHPAGVLAATVVRGADHRPDRRKCEASSSTT